MFHHLLLGMYRLAWYLPTLTAHEYSMSPGFRVTFQVCCKAHAHALETSLAMIKVPVSWLLWERFLACNGFHWASARLLQALTARQGMRVKKGGGAASECMPSSLQISFIVILWGFLYPGEGAECPNQPAHQPPCSPTWLWQLWRGSAARSSKTNMEKRKIWLTPLLEPYASPLSLHSKH